jgi:putative phage-type endonuclease
MDQRTDTWFAARLGRVTASRVHEIMATLKDGKPAAARANYMADIVLERLTGKRAEGFSNDAMDWGTQTEPQARAAYSAKTGELVTEVGFVNHPTLMAGASPDGLVGDDGLVEIKCPTSSTALETLFTQKIAKKYIDQMQWQLLVTGRAWCDFCSFDPRLPEHLQCYIQRVPRDNKRIAELETAVAKFLEEVDTQVKTLQEMKL